MKYYSWHFQRPDHNNQQFLEKAIQIELNPKKRNRIIKWSSYCFSNANCSVRKWDPERFSLFNFICSQVGYPGYFSSPWKIRTKFPLIGFDVKYPNLQRFCGSIWRFFFCSSNSRPHETKALFCSNFEVCLGIFIFDLLLVYWNWSCALLLITFLLFEGVHFHKQSIFYPVKVKVIIASWGSPLIQLSRWNWTIKIYIIIFLINIWIYNLGFYNLWKS